MSPKHLRTSSPLVKTSVAEDAIVRHAREVVSLGAFVTQFFETSLCVEWVLQVMYDLVLVGKLQDTACNNSMFTFSGLHLSWSGKPCPKIPVPLQLKCSLPFSGLK